MILTTYKSDAHPARSEVGGMVPVDEEDLMVPARIPADGHLTVLQADGNLDVYRFLKQHLAGPVGHRNVRPSS